MQEGGYGEEPVFNKSSRSKKRGDTFADIKKAIDEGYERFWSAPHRIKLRPQCVPFGYLDFSGEGQDEQDCSSDLT